MEIIKIDKTNGLPLCRFYERLNMNEKEVEAFVLEKKPGCKVAYIWAQYICIPE
jgi:hypothetical protein